VATAELDRELAEIERALDRDDYSPGAWQRFLERAAAAPRADLAQLAPVVSRVSDKLHARGRPRTGPFERALAAEILGALAGLALLALAAATASLPGLVLAAVVLAVTLQPLLKVGAGLALGLDFSYAYLAGFEPRFKLRYGSFLAAPAWKRVAYHAAGVPGSPFALLLVAAVARPSHPTLSAVLAVLALLHLALGVALLAAAAAGVRRLPGVGLLRLSSGGAAGFELRHLRRAGTAG